MSLALSAALCGCYKDDSGEYEIPLSGVSIASDDAISFSVGVEGSYEPVIEWAGTSESDYDYKWTDNGRTVISTERVLKYTFTDAGDHYLTFQMTDKKTGLVYGKDFKMTANSEFFMGWLVLSEGADKSSRLSFVALDSFKSYPDIYTSMFPGEQLGTGPVGFACYGIRKSDQVTVIQNSGAVVLDGSSFKKVVDFSSEFIGGKFPEEAGGFKIKAIGYSHRGTDLVMSENGNLYERISATGYSAKFQNSMFSTEPFISAAGSAKFSYMTFPGANSTVSPIFDESGNRWLAYYTTNTIPKQIPAFDKDAAVEFEDGFDYCSGMSSDVKLEYAQTYQDNTAGTLKLANALEKAGTYYVNTAQLKLNATSNHITVSGLVQKELPSDYAISSDSEFFIPRGNTSCGFYDDLHVFFSIGSRVYFYHFDTGIAYLYHDFSKDAPAPSGRIVAMVQNGDASQLGVAFSDGHLMICKLDKSILTSIRQNNIDPETYGGMVLAHIHDIPDGVVSLAFKYGKADNYTGSKIAK